MLEAEIPDVESLAKLEDKKPWDDINLAAGRPALLAKLVYKDRKTQRWNIQLTRAYLAHFERLAILRRGPGAFIPQDWHENSERQSLEGLLPLVQNYTVNIQQDPKLAAEYQSTHISLLTDLAKKLSNRVWTKGTEATKGEAAGDQEKLKSITTLYREFQIASASMDIYRLGRRLTAHDFGTKATDVSTMRASGVTFLQLGLFLLDLNEPKPTTALGWLKIAVRRSPILRYILFYLKENILNREEQGKIEKVLITESIPILAYFYELVLQMLGINCRVLHSDLSQQERKALADSFNSDDPQSCQILIQMYSVGFAGSNLHKNCSRVLVASQAHSLPVQWQAIHRVIRVGQEKDVQVYRLKVANSYDSFRESRQIEKLLPEYGARAWGPTKDALVQLLNLFQYEVDDAWKSEEAKKLVREESLLYDSEPTPSKPKTSTTSPHGIKSEPSESTARIHIKKDEFGEGTTQSVKVKDEVDTQEDTKQVQTEGTSQSAKTEDHDDVHIDKKKRLNNGKLQITKKEEVACHSGLQNIPPFPQASQGVDEDDIDEKDFDEKYFDEDDVDEKDFDEIDFDEDDFDEKYFNEKYFDKEDLDEKDFDEDDFEEKYSDQKDVEKDAMPSDSTTGEKPKKRPFPSSTSKSAPEDRGWFRTREASPEELPFIRLQTRDSYYAEFKLIPEAARKLFCHKKNALRRLLSYGNGDGSAKVWTANDLDNPAVLERALELMLRVRLGAGEIEMLPLPQIDFSLVSQRKRDTLNKFIGALDQTDQDVEAAAGRTEARGKDGMGEQLKGIDLNGSLQEIDGALEQEKRSGRPPKSTTEPKNWRVKKQDPEEEYKRPLDAIPAFEAQKKPDEVDVERQADTQDDDAANKEDQELKRAEPKEQSECSLKDVPPFKATSDAPLDADDSDLEIISSNEIQAPSKVLKSWANMLRLPGYLGR
jgi:hypothetical protein